MSGKELREADSCRAAVRSCAMASASTQARPRAAAVWRSNKLLREQAGPDQTCAELCRTLILLLLQCCDIGELRKPHAGDARPRLRLSNASV